MRRVICHCQSNFQTFYLVAVEVLAICSSDISANGTFLPTLITQLNYKIHIFTKFSALLAYYGISDLPHVDVKNSLFGVKNNAKILSSAFKLTTYHPFTIVEQVSVCMYL